MERQRRIYKFGRAGKSFVVTIKHQVETKNMESQARRFARLRGERWCQYDSSTIVLPDNTRIKWSDGSITTHPTAWIVYKHLEKPARFKIGDEVTVERRFAHNVNKPGGFGQITDVSADHRFYTVHYPVEKTTEVGVDVTYLSEPTRLGRRAGLGRCPRCGSLRKDCGSCDKIEEERLKQLAIEQARQIESIPPVSTTTTDKKGPKKELTSRKEKRRKKNKKKERDRKCTLQSLQLRESSSSSSDDMFFANFPVRRFTHKKRRKVLGEDDGENGESDHDGGGGVTIIGDNGNDSNVQLVLDDDFSEGNSSFSDTSNESNYSNFAADDSLMFSQNDSFRPEMSERERHAYDPEFIALETNGQVEDVLTEQIRHVADLPYSALLNYFDKTNKSVRRLAAKMTIRLSKIQARLGANRIHESNVTILDDLRNEIYLLFQDFRVQLLRDYEDPLTFALKRLADRREKKSYIKSMLSAGKGFRKSHFESIVEQREMDFDNLRREELNALEEGLKMSLNEIEDLLEEEEDFEDVDGDDDYSDSDEDEDEDEDEGEGTQAEIIMADTTGEKVRDNGDDIHANATKTKKRRRGVFRDKADRVKRKAEDGGGVRRKKKDKKTRKDHYCSGDLRLPESRSNGVRIVRIGEKVVQRSIRRAGGRDCRGRVEGDGDDHHVGSGGRVGSSYGAEPMIGDDNDPVNGDTVIDDTIVIDDDNDEDSDDNRENHHPRRSKKTQIGRSITAANKINHSVAPTVETSLTMHSWRRPAALRQPAQQQQEGDEDEEEIEEEEEVGNVCDKLVPEISPAASSIASVLERISTLKQNIPRREIDWAFKSLAALLHHQQGQQSQNNNQQMQQIWGLLNALLFSNAGVLSNARAKMSDPPPPTDEHLIQAAKELSFVTSAINAGRLFYVDDRPAQLLVSKFVHLFANASKKKCSSLPSCSMYNTLRDAYKSEGSVIFSESCPLHLSARASNTTDTSKLLDLNGNNSSLILSALPTIELPAAVLLRNLVCFCDGWFQKSVDVGGLRTKNLESGFLSNIFKELKSLTKMDHHNYTEVHALILLSAVVSNVYSPDTVQSSALTASIDSLLPTVLPTATQSSTTEFSSTISFPEISTSSVHLTCKFYSALFCKIPPRPQQLLKLSSTLTSATRFLIDSNTREMNFDGNSVNYFTTSSPIHCAHLLAVVAGLVAHVIQQLRSSLQVELFEIFVDPILAAIEVITCSVQLAHVGDLAMTTCLAALRSIGSALCLALPQPKKSNSDDIEDIFDIDTDQILLERKIRSLNVVKVVSRLQNLIKSTYPSSLYNFKDDGSEIGKDGKKICHDKLRNLLKTLAVFICVDGKRSIAELHRSITIANSSNDAHHAKKLKLTLSAELCKLAPVSKTCLEVVKENVGDFLLSVVSAAVRPDIIVGGVARRLLNTYMSDLSRILFDSASETEDFVKAIGEALAAHNQPLPPHLTRVERECITRAQTFINLVSVFQSPSFSSRYENLKRSFFLTLSGGFLSNLNYLADSNKGFVDSNYAELACSVLSFAARKSNPDAGEKYMRDISKFFENTLSDENDESVIGRAVGRKTASLISHCARGDIHSLSSTSEDGTMGLWTKLLRQNQLGSVFGSRSVLEQRLYARGRNAFEIEMDSVCEVGLSEEEVGHLVAMRRHVLLQIVPKLIYPKTQMKSRLANLELLIQIVRGAAGNDDGFRFEAADKEIFSCAICANLRICVEMLFKCSGDVVPTPTARKGLELGFQLLLLVLDSPVQGKENENELDDIEEEEKKEDIVLLTLAFAFSAGRMICSGEEDRKKLKEFAVTSRWLVEMAPADESEDVMGNFAKLKAATEGLATVEFSLLRKYDLIRAEVQESDEKNTYVKRGEREGNAVAVEDHDKSKKDEEEDGEIGIHLSYLEARMISFNVEAAAAGL